MIETKGERKQETITLRIIKNMTTDTATIWKFIRKHCIIFYSTKRENLEDVFA